MSKFERALLYLAVLAVIGAPLADAAMVRTASQGNLAVDMTRSPAFATGASAAINPDTVTAASSSSLSIGTRWALQCTTDTYLRFGTAASGQDATSSNIYLPAGAWLTFSVLDTVQYVSTLSKGSDGICYLNEAR